MRTILCTTGIYWDFPFTTGILPRHWDFLHHWDFTTSLGFLHHWDFTTIEVMVPHTIPHTAHDHTRIVFPTNEVFDLCSINCICLLMPVYWNFCSVAQLLCAVYRTGAGRGDVSTQLVEMRLPTERRCKRFI